MISQLAEGMKSDSVAQAQGPSHVSYFMFQVFTGRRSQSRFLYCFGRGGLTSPLTPLQVHSLKLALEGVEKERDFYFGKLREIELLCQEHGQENDDLVQRLMEVLYASDEHVSVRRALDCCILKRRSWSGCCDQCAF